VNILSTFFEQEEEEAQSIGWDSKNAHWGELGALFSHFFLWPVGKFEAETLWKKRQKIRPAKSQSGSVEAREPKKGGKL